MSDSTPLMRQWLLLRILCARTRGATLKEMAAETGRSIKTIRRDLLALQQVGFPLEETASDHGRKHWKLAHVNGQGQPELSFTLTEALSLYLGREFLDPLAGTDFFDGACSAFRKIRASLSEQALRYLDQLRSAIVQTTFGHGDCEGRREVVDALLVGIEDRCVTRILYHSARLDVPAEYDVHPYGFIYHKGSLYLVAFAPHHEELRHYKIDRLRDAVVLADQPFERPEDFDLRAHLSHTLGVHHTSAPPQRVRIRFDKEAARYLKEHRWHSSQHITEHDNDSVTLELELSDLTELKSWVLSFGSKAMVEEPRELREEMRAEMQATLHQYGGVEATP